MTNDKGILIKNIYYMLSYAFHILKQSTYEKVTTEKFENIQDLFAEILIKGIGKQLKQGLYKEYVDQKEDLLVLRGKINLNGTIRNRIQRRQQMFCEFDELTEDNLYNQILKMTMQYLIRDCYVSKERKNKLKKLIVFFDQVSMISLTKIQWNRLIYHKNNKNYELLLNICYFVLDGMIQTTEDGKYQVMGFLEEHMQRLYEKFILEYYKQHYAKEFTAKVLQINWNLTGENEESMIRFLPAMKTDITLYDGNKTLIIDAKYYGKTMQQNYDKKSIYSAHMYQIFAYVKNKDKENTGKVSGLLLYAKTQEELTPDCAFEIGGNKISTKTLDLNCDFQEIRKQLDKIAEEFKK